MKIIADLHTHTIASTHAYSTILENCTFAAREGLTAVGMTDHAVNMPDSPHIWHFENLKALPRKIEGVTVLKGAEVNIIDTDGGIDLPERLTKRLEWIVASFHSQTYPPATAEEHTQTYINAAKNNPCIDAIGHPASGMFPFEMEPALKAFRDNGKLVEINESALFNKKMGRENTVEIIKLCKKMEVPVAVSTDCHFCYMIGKMPESVKLLQELDFPEELVVNADWQRLKAFLQTKRPWLEL